MFYFIVGLKMLYLAVNIPISALIRRHFKMVSSNKLMKRYTIILNVKGKYNNTSRAMECKLLLLSSSSSNFSLLSFGWEIFTYPGMQQSTGLGSVVLFVV